MGSIVKSIGKAIKKVAKGIKKIIKKIGPALIIAAAVYAGVAFYGSTLAGASGATLGPTNFMSGLKASKVLLEKLSLKMQILKIYDPLIFHQNKY